MKQVPFTNNIRNDKDFMTFENWLLDNGATFPHVELCSMGENVRVESRGERLDARMLHEGHSRERDPPGDHSLQVFHVVRHGNRHRYVIGTEERQPQF